MSEVSAELRKEKSVLMKSDSEETKELYRKKDAIEQILQARQKEIDATKKLKDEIGALTGASGTETPSRAPLDIPSMITPIEFKGLKTEVFLEQFDFFIEEVEGKFLDLSGFIQGALLDSFDMIGTALGSAFTGKDFGLDNMLMMFADWGKRLGGIMVAAGLSLDAFKKLGFTNPLGVAAFGAALIVASSAVKAAVSSNPMTGVNQSYGGASPGGGQDIEGLRNLGQFNVSLSGELVARGTDLVTVLNNENNRSDL
jgi:hypothetical protein